jgi:hypothetical protein
MEFSHKHNQGQMKISQEDKALREFRKIIESQVMFLTGSMIETLEIKEL